MISAELGRILNESSVYETEPWGFQHKLNFYNQVVRLETFLSPGELLSAIGKIELLFDRTRARDKYLAREMDIDILFYNDTIIDQPGLIIPHPRLHERNFALIPLLELCPNMVHPVFKLTIEELAARCSDQKKVVKTNA